MDSNSNPGDVQRTRELHELLDQIQVPEDTLSDISAEYQTDNSYMQSFTRHVQVSPDQQEDFFTNSINSEFSPKNQRNQDSGFQTETSQAFTPEQVSSMLDWAKTHVTPAEGLFPQILAPSMTLDEFEESFSGAFKNFQAPVKRSGSSLPAFDTHEKPSKEMLTFSPRQENWFYNPSRRSSANQSFQSKPQTQKSYSQLSEASVNSDEFSKLKTEIANSKIALRKEQEMHESTKNELYKNTQAVHSLELEKEELASRVTDLEEHVKILRKTYKNNSSLEQLRGKHLEHSKAEIKRLQELVTQQEKSVKELKYALSQKQVAESEAAAQKEVEELSLELSKLQIVNKSQSKRITQLTEKCESSEKLKEKAENELKYYQESWSAKFTQLESKLKNQFQKIQEKNSYIQELEESLKDTQQQLKAFQDQEAQEVRHHNQANYQIDLLTNQLQTKQSSAADYEAQLQKIKAKHETEVNQLKSEIAQLKKLPKEEVFTESQTSEDKETIAILQNELEKIQEQFHNQGNQISSLESEYKEQIAQLKQEKEELISQLEENPNLVNSQLQEQKELIKQYQQEVQNLHHANEKTQQLADHYKTQLETHPNSLKKLREEVYQELQNKFNQEKVTLEANHKKQLNELSKDFNSRVKNLEKEYEDNINSVETEFREKTKSMEAEYQQSLKELKEQKQKVQDTKFEIEQNHKSIGENQETIKELRNKIKELEREKKLKEEELSLKYDDDFNSKLTEIETMFKHKKEEIKKHYEKEKDHLKQLLNEEKEELNYELNTLTEETNSYKKLINEYKLKNQELNHQKETLENLVEDLETQVKTQETEFQTQLNSKLSTTQKTLNQKLKDREKELQNHYENKIQELQESFEKELENERQRHKELLSMKEQAFKADSLRSQDEFSQTLQEKEKHWEEQLSRKEKLLKNQLDKQLRSKDTEIEQLKEDLEKEKRTLREEVRNEFREKLEKIKENHSKQKRELERENRKLKEASENAFENAKKELELNELEKLNQERKEWDRKMQQKVKLIQNKHQKEIQDKETMIRLECEQTVADEKKKLKENYNQQLKKSLEEQEQYFQELKTAALEKKAHEVEIKLRSELQEAHICSMNQLESEYYHRMQKLRDEMRSEMEKRVDKMRESHKSFEVPKSSESPRVSMLLEDFRSYQVQQAYKRRNELYQMQSYTSSQCELTKKAEVKKIQSFLQHEFNTMSNCQVFSDLPQKGNNEYPELSELVHSFFESLQVSWQFELQKKSKELKQEQDKIITKYRNKVSKFENQRKKEACLQTQSFPEKSSEFTYQEAKEDLVLVLEAFNSVLDKYNEDFTESLSLQSKLSESRSSKEDYKHLINDLHKLAVKVSWIISSNDSPSEESSEIVKLRMNLSESKSKLAKYEEDLRKLTDEYRNYMVRTKDWIENANREKEDWEHQKEDLLEQLSIWQSKAQEVEEAQCLTPEMLSPDETCSLILGIFKRSNFETLAVQLLNKNPEFLNLIQEFLDGAYESIERSRQEAWLNRRYSRPETFETLNSVRSSQSIMRPRTALSPSLPPQVPRSATRLKRVDYSRNIYSPKSTY